MFDLFLLFFVIFSRVYLFVFYVMLFFASFYIFFHVFGPLTGCFFWPFDYFQNCDPSEETGQGRDLHRAVAAQKNIKK